MKLKGAQMVWECMIREGVDVVFGYPGGAIIATYDALVDYPQVHHVLTRHECNAAFAADGYARSTGKVGVCMATSGPGATNLVTGLAGSLLDSVPVVAITGQVASNLVGSDAFQETDVTGVTLPVTKHNYLITHVEEIPRVFKEAFYIARSGRPGPVLIDICRDAQAAMAEFEYPETVRLAGYRPKLEATEEQIRRTAQLINNSRRPIILAGHGIHLSGAADELREFVEQGNLPVTTTLLGISSIPESHPLSLRMMGMHGEAYVNHAIQAADVIIALGMRFDDRVTGNLKSYAQNARVIHVDIDPAELNKNVKAEIGIVGDVKNVLHQLLPHIEWRERAEWLDEIAAGKADTQARDILNQDVPDEALLAPFVIRSIWEETQGDALIVTDVGQHQMWEAQYFRHNRRNQLFTSGGLGSMGYALPASMGVKFGHPNEEVWVICGDGGFQMSLNELATVIQEGTNQKIAVINNSYLGMVRQWQDLMFNRRYSATPMLSPDFVKLAEAYGVCGMRATKQSEVTPVLRAARNHPGPVLIEFKVESEVNVFPMVKPGLALHEMVRRPMPESIMGK